MKVRVLVGLLALSAHSLSAQALPLPYWQHSQWVGENAPPTPGDYSVKRSADGYLWLGATNGMIRFDGIRFTVMDSANTPAFRGIRQGSFYPTLLDKHGVLWIRGPGGSVFTYANGIVQTVFRQESKATGAITEDGAGRLWIATPDGIRLIENGRLVAVRLPAGVPDTSAFGIERDTSDGVWIGSSRDGLWHVQQNHVERFGTGRIRPLLQSRDGVVWAIGEGLGAGLGLWHLVEGRWIEVHLSGEPSRKILTRVAVEGSDGSVWFPTTGTGLLRWHNGRIERFSKDDGLSNNRVHDVYADSEGVVWASTDAGLDRLRPSVFASIERRNGLPYDGGDLFAEDTSGAVWGSSSEGSDQYLLDAGIIRNQSGAITSVRALASESLYLQLIAPSHFGGVWIGPGTGGILRLTAQGQQIIRTSDGFPKTRIGMAFESRDGTLWVKSLVGDFGTFREGKYKPFSFADEDRPVSHGFAQDALGRTWLASAQHRMTVLIRDSIVSHFVLPEGGGAVTSLAPEAGDTMWASTHSTLIRIVGQRAVTVAPPGLQRVMAAGVELAVSRGSLWLASTSGFARIPLVELHRAADGGAAVSSVEVFGPLDGLAVAHAPTQVPTTIRVGRDGRVWVATPGGLGVADPAFRMATVHPRQVRIEEFSVGGKAMTVRDGAIVAPSPGRISFYFSTPTVLLAERVRMQYRLDGADDKWVDATLPRVATYNQLRPGHFVFRVRAWDETGKLIPREATLAFRILPTWYQSWWFILLCSATVAIVTFAGAVTWQKRRARHASERERARFDTILAERARIARELHDTLLQGFTGITLQLESVRSTLEERTDPGASDLAQILVQADATLRESREMLWDIRSPDVSENFDAALEAVSQQILSRSDVTLHFAIKGTSRPLTRAVESTLVRILREAVFNALRHAGPTAMWVEVEYEARRVRMVVRDDGRGADREQLLAATLAGHWGIAGMRERAARAGGSLDIETAIGEGLRLTLVIPAEPVE